MHPLSMTWVKRFLKTLEPLDLYAWDLLETADPLKFILHLRFKRKLSDREFKLVRTYLTGWCEANDAIYKRSHWKKWDFKAKILIKGLGPIKDNDPF